MTGKKRSFKAVFSFTCILIFGITWGLFFSEFLDTREDKLLIMRSHLLYDYYDQDGLKLILQKKLGANYTDNLQEDFDNYVLTMVLHELQTIEDDKWKRYNDFFSRDRMKKYEESNIEMASMIYGKAVDDTTYYLKLTDFYQGITHKKVESLLPEMELYQNLIIDLRGNPGGHLSELVQVADLFLDKGQVVYKSKKSNQLVTVYARKEKVLEFRQIVLLVNHLTASSSELLVLALQENLANVVTIGTPTYGKRISFGQRKFYDGSGIIFISSIMVGANGHEINSDGIFPDIICGYAAEHLLDLTEEERDIRIAANEQLQLKAALEFLK